MTTEPEVGASRQHRGTEKFKKHGNILVVLCASVSLWLENELSAAHGDDDFQLVPIGQQRFAELAARHDLAVPFHRQALADEIQMFQKLGEIGRLLESVEGAVDRELNHLQ